MQKKSGFVFLALGFFAVASLCLAQNADRNTAGPTKNDLSLRVSEPVEGATITGSSVRVTVDYARTIFGQGQGTKFGETTYPPAKFNVFLDGKLQQTLTAGESNVATLENVPPGPHKITIEAANISGEVIDRKQISITTTAKTATAQTSSTSSDSSSSAAAAPAPPPATYSSSPPSQTSSPQTAPPQTSTTLPRTGSSAPSLAVAGLALALSGVFLSRKTR
ncbi:MAG TPA: NPXTG-anchored protein [Thermoanaerobaculia bacterium]|nr:NPXTG-anchored protein [Thermoanaerobaculia bacterium]